MIQRFFFAVYKIYIYNKWTSRVHDPSQKFCYILVKSKFTVGMKKMIIDDNHV